MKKNVYLSDKKDAEIIEYINKLDNFSEWIRWKVKEELLENNVDKNYVLKHLYPNAYQQKDAPINTPGDAPKDKPKDIVIITQKDAPCNVSIDMSLSTPVTLPKTTHKDSDNCTYDYVDNIPTTKRVRSIRD